MTEAPQSYENHTRIIPGYHYALFGILAINLILRLVQLIRHPGWMNAWEIAMAVGFILMGWYLRVFPLAVQDRVIRMEERQRLGRLLPDALRPRLGEFTRGQLVGLRYASDEELPELAARVLNEGIRDKKAIKQLVRQWRPDNLRA
ncbi:MAG TPA: DUF6526 family protein [Gemmatimonadales bacterium]|nr:DUF6526 family protein [Gemmatimonadales bacterium]